VICFHESARMCASAQVRSSIQCRWMRSSIHTNARYRPAGLLFSELGTELGQVQQQWLAARKQLLESPAPVSWSICAATTCRWPIRFIAQTPKDERIRFVSSLSLSIIADSDIRKRGHNGYGVPSCCPVWNCRLSLPQIQRVDLGAQPFLHRNAVGFPCSYYILNRQPRAVEQSKL